MFNKQRFYHYLIVALILLPAANQVATKRDERHLATPNLVNMNFNPAQTNQVWAGDIGACWDNTVVERFFGSLKHDWILKTYECMAADVAAYMKYYNLKRLHTSNDDMTPVEYENYQLNVSTWG